MFTLWGARVEWPALIAFGALSLLTLAVGGQFTRVDAWYENLAKPPLTPPGWVIGLAWWIIFALLALSMAIVWSSRPHDARTWTTMGMLALNLGLNAAWSWFFFRAHEIALALADLIALWCTIGALALLAGERSTVAGALLIPYLAWVSFAGYLNWSILRLNA